MYGLRFDQGGPRLIRVRFKAEAIQKTARGDGGEAPIVYHHLKSFHEYIFRADAVESWSVYQERTNDEIQADVDYIEATGAKDVFYHDLGIFSFEYYTDKYLNEKVLPLLKTFESNRSRAKIYGTNIDHHFDFNEAYRMPWHWYLKAAVPEKSLDPQEPAPTECTTDCNEE